MVIAGNIYSPIVSWYFVPDLLSKPPSERIQKFLISSPELLYIGISVLDDKDEQILKLELDIKQEKSEKEILNQKIQLLEENIVTYVVKKVLWTVGSNNGRQKYQIISSSHIPVYHIQKVTRGAYYMYTKSWPILYSKLL